MRENAGELDEAPFAHSFWLSCDRRISIGWTKKGPDVYTPQDRRVYAATFFENQKIIQNELLLRRRDDPTRSHRTQRRFMEIFELPVGPDLYEMRCPQETEKLSFSTLLAAFAYAQNAMSESDAEMLVRCVHGTERVPLYRMA